MKELTVKEEVRAYLGWDEEFLTFLLGEELLPDKEKHLQLTRSVVTRVTLAKQKATEWLDEKREDLYVRICEEWDYCQKRQNPDWQDTISLIVGIADIITVICVGVPPFLVATLLVKKGLHYFCKCDET